MRVEIIEKNDGVIVAKFTATSPIEATLMAMASMGEAQAQAAISMSSSAYGNKATAAFGGFTVNVIEQMQASPEKK